MTNPKQDAILTAACASFALFLGLTGYPGMLLIFPYSYFAMWYWLRKIPAEPFADAPAPAVGNIRRIK